MDCLTCLARIPSGINAYTDRGHRNKRLMHSAGRAFLQRVARDLDLQTAERSIRSNQGGIAVSGEVTLDAPGLYVWLQESSFGTPGVTICYRTQPTRGSSASRHGANRFTSPRDLVKPDRYTWFLADLKRMRAEALKEVATC